MLFSTQAATAEEQAGIFFLSLSIFPLAITVAYLLYPRELAQLVATLPLPQQLKPAPPPPIPKKTLPPKPEKPSETKPSAPEKKPDLASRIRRRPEIIKVIPRSIEDSTVESSSRVPSIVPRGMMKPPVAGSKEKFPTIIPKQIAEKSPPPPKYRRLETTAEQTMDLQTLISKAKGMKYNLSGWWPLGWSRVIPHPDLPAQFWKLEKGKPTHGLLLGQDMRTGEFVAWIATVCDGVFRGVSEALRTKSEKELVEKAKNLMKRIDIEKAAEEEEKQVLT